MLFEEILPKLRQGYCASRKKYMSSQYPQKRCITIEKQNNQYEIIAHDKYGSYTSYISAHELMADDWFLVKKAKEE